MIHRFQEVLNEKTLEELQVSAKRIRENLDMLHAEPKPLRIPREVIRVMEEEGFATFETEGSEWIKGETDEGIKREVLLARRAAPKEIPNREIPEIYKYVFEFIASETKREEYEEVLAIAETGIVASFAEAWECYLRDYLSEVKQMLKEKGYDPEIKETPELRRFVEMRGRGIRSIGQIMEQKDLLKKWSLETRIERYREALLEVAS